MLDRLAARPGGPTVLHDLAIPIPNISANIDHVVVSGRRVLVVDSKGWRPARYWSLGGMAFRGWRRFGHAKSTTPRMAVDGLTRYLRGRGVRARLVTPVVAVWPSSDRGRLSVALLGMDGCRVVRGERLARAVRRAVRLRPADPEIVEALRRLLNAPRGQFAERACWPRRGTADPARCRRSVPAPSSRRTPCRSCWPACVSPSPPGAVHWPPMPVLWAALVVAAWAEPPPLLTGKRDAAGSPTPAGPGGGAGAAPVAVLAVAAVAAAGAEPGLAARVAAAGVVRGRGVRRGVGVVFPGGVVARRGWPTRPPRSCWCAR